MSKRPPDDDTMREEYDFTGGVRGKYAKRCAAGSNVVVLDPDVAEPFKGQAADPGFRIVNDVLDAFECLEVVEVLSRSDMIRGRAGARHLLGVPAISSLARDARLRAIAADFVGDAATPFRATLFDTNAPARTLC